MHILASSSRRRAIARAATTLAACAATAALAACGSDSSDSTTAESAAPSAAAAEKTTDKPVNIAFFGLAAKNVYSMTMFKAMEERAKALNAKLEFFDGQYDGGVQLRQVQDATTSGRFQALVVMANDAVGIAPAVKQALAKGLTVSATQYPIGKDPTQAAPQIEGITTQAIEDVVVGAQKTAEAVNKACEGRDPCKALMLWGNRKSASEQAKVKPFKDTLTSNVKLVGEIDTQFLRAEGRSATTDALQANPDLDVVASSGDQMTYGAEEAARKAGRSVGTGPKDLMLVGYGATTEGVEKIRKGEWLSAFVLLPKQMGVKALELTVDAVRGKDVPEAERGVEQSSLSSIGPVADKETLEKDPSFTGEYPAT